MSLVRKPAVAGTFYPGERAELESTLDLHLGPGRADRVVRAVVVPHAGYVYSGRTAGAVYARVHIPDRCVVLCPNHTGGGVRRSIYPKGVWQTPIGDVPVDDDLADRIAERAGLEPDAQAHAREHALEVQLPFLLRRNPRARLTAICLGMLKEEDCVRIGEAIAAVLAELGESVLLVASTDMSHYIPADRAERLDRMAIARIEAVDAGGLYRTVFENDISMCGIIPTTVVLSAVGAAGADRAELVRYSNSAEASGDRSAVVGYAGLIVP